MKILKMILVFVLVVGGVYLATQWNTIFTSGTGVEDTSPINLQEKCDNISSEWAERENWDEDLLKSQLSTLERENKLKRYESSKDYETARNEIRVAATDKLYNAIFREFHSPSCDDKIVNLNYAGVDVLIKTFNMDDDGSLKKVQQVKSVYDQINRFVSSNPHSVSPNYNAASNSWASYDAQEKGIRNTAADFRAKTVYQEHLSMITRFINGLNDQNIKVTPTKQQFYAKLASQISDHFEKSDFTEGNRKLFFNALNKFSTEYPNESAVEPIQAKYEAFKEKCNNNTTNNSTN